MVVGGQSVKLFPREASLALLHFPVQKGHDSDGAADGLAQVGLAGVVESRRLQVDTGAVVELTLVDVVVVDAEHIRLHQTEGGAELRLGHRLNEWTPYARIQGYQKQNKTVFAVRSSKHRTQATADRRT